MSKPDTTITRPNRIWRRTLNGHPCVACGLRMYFTEIVRITEGPIERFAHIQCVQLLIEALAQQVDGPAVSPAPAHAQGELFDLTSGDPALD